MGLENQQYFREILNRLHTAESPPEDPDEAAFWLLLKGLKRKEPPRCEHCTNIISLETYKEKTQK